MEAFGYVWTFLQIGMLAGVGYVCADAVERDSPRLRLSLMALTGLLLQAMAFYILAPLGGFEYEIVVVVSLLGGATALGVALRRGEAFVSRMRRDWQTGLDWARATCEGRLKWATLSVGALFGVHALRALAIPPLAWDALTYHLVRAALWVKRGGLPASSTTAETPEWFDPRAFADYGGPEAWTYYRHFLPMGDALSAWTMLPSRSDGLLPLTWAAVWVCLVWAAYAVARQLGADRDRAWLAAIGAGLIPAVRAHLFTPYIDNLIAALVLLGTTCFLAAEREGRRGLIVPGLWAFALAAAVKKTGLPFLAAGALTYLYLAWRYRDQLSLSTIVVGVVGSCLVALPPFGYLWWATGSPLYPEGLGLVERNPAWAYLYQEFQIRPFWLHFKLLFTSGYGSWMRHVNLGPVFVAVLPLGLYVLVDMIYRSKRRAALMPLLIGGSIVAYLILSDLRGSGLNQVRYWSVLPIAMLLAIARCDEEWATASLVVVCLQGIVLWALPIQWGESDARATLHLFGALVPYLVAAGAVVAAGSYRSWALEWRMGLAALPCLLGIGLELESVRTHHRSAVYDELHQSRGNYPIANIPINGASLPPGAHLELSNARKGNRIAVTSGWDGKGHNWYVYPLFGEHLRREVYFVPSRRHVELPLRRHEQIDVERDFEKWRRRLRRLDIDYVATLQPEAPELEYMRAHSESFTPLTSSRYAPDTTLFRFEPE